MRLKNLSLVTLLVTFVLLLWGAVVHNSQSSLACPDWPLCYDQFFPEMKGAILIEHGHRLLAGFVGFLTVLMVVFSFKERKNSEEDAHLFRASTLALFLVVAQGALGGITVIYRLPTIVSTSHLGLSLIYFSLIVYIHHKASLNLTDKSKLPANWKPIIRHGIVFSLAMLYSQIILGAFMRHAGAGASCGLGPQSSLMCMDIMSWTFKWWPSEGPAQLHMLHRIYGFLVFIVVTFFSLRSFRAFKGNQKFRILSLLPIVFLSFQVLIGILTVWFNLNIIPTTMHLAGAALSLTALWKLNLEMKSLEDKDLPEGGHSFLSDIVDLMKPKLSMLVMLTTFVGAMIAPTKINFFRALFSFFLVTMVVVGSAALNCYLERDVDGKMIRTQKRPLPSKRMRPIFAFLFGVFMVAISVILLCVYINMLTGLLSLLASVLYLYAYTPLKQKSPFAVYVGAIPGAIPPVLGWTSVTGELDMMAVSLFFILFVWQLPHFLAISLYLADDYESASIKVYPQVDPNFKFTKIGIFVFTAFLFGTALLPTFYLEMKEAYAPIAFILSLIFLIYSGFGLFMKAQNGAEKKWARNYFLGSLFYLPLILISLIFFKS